MNQRKKQEVSHGEALFFDYGEAGCNTARTSERNRDKDQRIRIADNQKERGGYRQSNYTPSVADDFPPDNIGA